MTPLIPGSIHVETVEKPGFQRKRKNDHEIDPPESPGIDDIGIGEGQWRPIFTSGFENPSFPTASLEPT